MTLTEAIRAFLFTEEIQDLRPNTIRNYLLALTLFRAFYDASDPELRTISVHDIRAFLHGLQSKLPESTSTIPRELRPLSSKSIRNVQETLS